MFGRLQQGSRGLNMFDAVAVIDAGRGECMESILLMMV